MVTACLLSAATTLKRKAHNGPHSLQLGPITSPVEQEGSIDFKENVAYITVGKDVMTENASYHRIQAPALISVPEYEDIRF